MTIGQLFSIAMAGSAFSGALLILFFWGMSQVRARGEDAIGAPVWLSLIVPPIIFLAVAINIRVAATEQQQAGLPIASPPPAVERMAPGN